MRRTSRCLGFSFATERRLACRSWGSLSDTRHVPRSARLDAVPERRHQAVWRQHVVRVGRRSRRGSAAARHGHRPSVLRQEGADRPVVPRATCLLTHLHWDHVQGLPFFTPLLREGARLDVYGPAQDDGRSLDEVVSTHDPSAAVPCQCRRIARHGQLSRHRRHRLLDRQVRREGPPDPAPRPDVRLPCRVQRSLDRLPVGSPTAVRRQLLGFARRARNWSKVSTC